MEMCKELSQLSVNICDKFETLKFSFKFSNINVMETYLFV